MKERFRQIVSLVEAAFKALVHEGRLPKAKWIEVRTGLRRKAQLWAAGGAVCLFVLLIIVHGLGAGRLVAGGRTIAVKRETLPITVTEVGQLEPKEYEIVGAPISGVLVELIKEGTYVHKGDAVGRMNDDDARDDLGTTEIAIKNRQALLHVAELDQEETGQDLEYERQKAGIQLELAELDLKELEQKPAATVVALATLDPQYWKVASEIAKKLADLDVEYGQAAEETSLKKYERQKVLAAKGVSSENDMAAARLQYEKDLTVHESAVIIRELLQKGTPESEIETAREKVKQARVKLEQIRKNAQAQVNLKKTAVAVAQAELDRSQETVDISRKIVESTAARAPVEGTVLYWGQEGRPHVGDYLWSGNGFVSITQMGKMLALTRVNEVDARRIGVGQKALIRLEAIPGKLFHGKVVRMAGLATDRDERNQGVLKRDLSGVMVFEVTVQIEESDRAMIPTLSGTVEIIIEELRDVIAVPPGAVTRRKGKDYVRVLEKGRVVERRVKVGGTYKSKTVVADGLREGDVVCLM